jgi:hypothetical protein
MSPVSRGRKKKGSGSGSGGSSGQSELRSAFSELLRDFLPLVAEEDPLRGELVTSEVIGEWWQLPGYADPERTVGLGLIGYAAGKATPAALALLRGMQALGVTERQRTEAREGAERLAARGMPEPAWVGALAGVTAHDCWQLADVFGDEATVLVVFERAGIRHGLVLAVAFSHLHHRVMELFVTDQPEDTLEDLRAQVADSAGVVSVEPIPVARARRLIEDGLGREDPGVPDTVADTRALALARCRELPEAEPVPVPPEYGEDERAAVVREFLGAADFTGIGDPGEEEAVAACARTIVDFGCDQDSGRPLRVGPGKITTFLEEWVPYETDLGEDELDLLPEVLRAWVRWAVGKTELPAAAVDELFESLEEDLEDFVEGGFDEDDDFPIESYLDGMPGDAPLHELRDVLERRQFAMPYYAVLDEDGGEIVGLDPADPDQRHRLVAGEYPETPEDGTRRLIAIKETVVDQLWDDDPPEAWQAARRLLAAGKDRDEILAELAGAFAEHGQEDGPAYRKELGELG